MNKPTLGKWNTSLITTEQGIRMAGGYKSGLWVDTNTHMSYKTESIAFIKNQEDANLIVTAVNACQSINPENPQAVVDQIEAMYKALRAMWNSDPDLSLAVQEQVKAVLNAIEKKEGQK